MATERGAPREGATLPTSRSCQLHRTSQERSADDLDREKHDIAETTESPQMKGNPPAQAGGMRQRKKPHMLPPLEKRRSSMDSRAEVGSPTPKWRRPSLEEQLILEETPMDGRPAIRLTRCPDAVANSPPPAAAAVPQAIHIANRYAPLEPIKPRDSKQL